jgi:hypothetical protein
MHIANIEINRTNPKSHIIGDVYSIKHHSHLMFKGHVTFNDKRRLSINLHITTRNDDKPKSIRLLKKSILDLLIALRV